MPEKILGLTKISAHMQTRIPKEAAERLGVKEGDRVLWILEGDKVCVKKAEIR